MAFEEWATDLICDNWELMDDNEIAEEAFNAGRAQGRREGMEEAAKIAEKAMFLDCVIDTQLATAELIRKAIKQDDTDG